MNLPPDLKTRVRASISRLHSPPRPPSQVRAWRVLFASAAVAAAQFFAAGGLAHGQGRASWFLFASTAGWSAVAALSIWGAYSRGASATGRARAWLLVIAVGTPSLLFAMMLAFAIAAPQITQIHPERGGYDCFLFTLGASLFPFVALIIGRRGSDPVHPAAAAGALGAASGAAGGAMVELWCPVALLRHVTLGHILPIALLSFAGALWGAHVLQLPPRSSSDARP